MSEETNAPRMSNPPPAEAAAPVSGTSEMASLRKEVIEARNLIIKTDNLLKNLHAEVKKLGDKHEEQENRHWMTSVTAYIVFALMAAVAAIAYARAEVRTARDEAQANEARAIALQKDAEKIKAADQTRRDASEKAMRVYELLGSEREGPGLNQAMAQALHLDRGQLSALETRAIDDRAAGLKLKIAEAIAPLESFLKSAGGTKTAQYAGLLLGQAYEEINNPTRAREVYERAERLYPGSEFAPMIRNRLHKLSATTGPLAPLTPTAAAPKPQ